MGRITAPLSFLTSICGQPWNGQRAKVPVHECIRRQTTDASAVSRQPMGLLRLAAYFQLSVFDLALLLFLRAGTLAWWRGWLLFALFFIIAMPAAALWLWRVIRRFVPPGALSTLESKDGTGSARFLFWARLAIYLVAALDDARFFLSFVPISIIGLGYVLLLMGLEHMTCRRRSINCSSRVSASRRIAGVW